MSKFIDKILKESVDLEVVLGMDLYDEAKDNIGEYIFNSNVEDWDNKGIFDELISTPGMSDSGVVYRILFFEKKSEWDANGFDNPNKFRSYVLKRDNGRWNSFSKSIKGVSTFAEQMIDDRTYDTRVPGGVVYVIIQQNCKFIDISKYVDELDLPHWIKKCDEVLAKLNPDFKIIKKELLENGEYYK